jgi:hypothetical protein
MHDAQCPNAMKMKNATKFDNAAPKRLMQMPDHGNNQEER